jgi:hypothetical protein
MLGIDEDIVEEFNLTLLDEMRGEIKQRVWWYVAENEFNPTTMIIRKPIQDYFKEYKYERQKITT